MKGEILERPVGKVVFGGDVSWDQPEELGEFRARDFENEEWDQIIKDQGLSIGEGIVSTFNGVRFPSYAMKYTLNAAARKAGRSAFYIVDLLRWVMQNTIRVHCETAKAQNPGKSLVWIWRSRPHLYVDLVEAEPREGWTPGLPDREFVVRMRSLIFEEVQDV